MSLILAAMLFIEGDRFSLAEVYQTYDACALALDTVGRDAVCIPSATPDAVLAPKSSPRPRPRPAKGN